MGIDNNFASMFVISWPGGLCDILAQGLIGLIEYSYQQGASSFSEVYLEKTSGLSVLGLEKSWMDDRPGSLLVCARVGTKCAQKRLVLVCGGRYIVLERCQE
jgi:hypothetical protein